MAENEDAAPLHELTAEQIGRLRADAARGMLAQAVGELRAARRAGPSLTIRQAVDALRGAMEAPADHGPLGGSKRQAIAAHSRLLDAVREQTDIIGRSVRSDAHDILAQVVAAYREATGKVIWPPH